MKVSAIAVTAALAAIAAVGRADGTAFSGDIVKMTEQNADFRHVLFTGHNVQVVAMALRPGEDIGEETHKVDQCFFFVQGTAQTLVAGNKASLGKDGVLCVPGGTRHNIRNAGSDALKLYTTYSPPQHPPGTIHRTKVDAQRAEESPAPRKEK